jgi:hypothetical protein
MDGGRPAIRVLQVGLNLSTQNAVGPQKGPQQRVLYKDSLCRGVYFSVSLWTTALKFLDAFLELCKIFFPPSAGAALIIANAG